jgi:hypothetical protein
MADPLARAIATVRRNPVIAIGGAVAGVVALAIFRPIGGDDGGPAENAPATTPPSPADLFAQQAELYGALHDFAEGGGGAPAPSPPPPPPVTTPPPVYVDPRRQTRIPRGGWPSSAPTLEATGPRTLASSRSPLPGGLSHPGAEARRVAITIGPTIARYLDGRQVRIPAGRRLPVAKGSAGGAITHVVVAGPYAGAHLARHSSTYAAFAARELERGDRGSEDRSSPDAGPRNRAELEAVG